MTGISNDAFTQFAGVKVSDPSIKLMVSLGGWDYFDNDTTTQPVFTTMVSSKASRTIFIDNLVAFLVCTVARSIS